MRAREAARRRAVLAMAVVAFFLAVAAGALPGGLTAPVRAHAASGDVLWAQIVSDVVTPIGDEILSVAPGADGTVYVCGVYDFPLFSGYVWVARYAPNGNQIWLHPYGESLGIDADPAAIAVDRHGNLIVVGRAVVAGNASILVLKYGRDGTLRWDRIFDGVAADLDFATDVVVDRAGGVYLAAASTGMGTDLDYLVVKYSAAGAYCWESRYVGPGTNDVPTAIAIDSDRATYVTGASPNLAGDRDIVTVKIDAAGNQVWVRRWNGPQGLGDEAYDIACTGGAIVVDGLTDGAATGANVALLSYAAGGAGRWARVWNGAADLGDAAPYLAVDADGNAWTTGTSVNTAGENRALLIKWNAAGRRLWTRRDARGGVVNSAYLDLTIDAGGTAWCAGFQQPVSGAGDVLVGKYSPNGRRLWTRAWNGLAGDYDQARAVCLSGSSWLYVGGLTFVPGTTTDPVLIKYRR